MRRQLMWTLVVRSFAALMFGALALVWPEVTVEALALLFGAYVLADGLALLTSALRRRGGDMGHRTAHTAGGVLGIAVGVITIAWPGVTALALVSLIGAWAVGAGTAELWAATRFRRELHHEWILFAAGGASVVAGVLVLARPDAGALVVAQVAGVYAMISGLLTLAAAWRLHGTTAAAHRPRRTRHAWHT
ncbi:HdeD family acid-resistance protein [Streptomyces longwoodensis]|uniref:HdeD family acid-resistance protein n=1 Tax=Streptomyces longwoodensis TaxID=68231 RepID=UPI0033F6A952